MSRRFFAAALLGALLALAGAVPGPGYVPRAIAASCSGWTSNTEPPPTIRVYRHLTGAVDTVDFKAYAKNVLSREWISSWTTESLRSGALAVKNYAWYQVLHWRGGTNADGECFDLRDDTWDQVYDPTKPVYATAAAAVDDTWATLVHKNGLIFATYYNAGNVNEPCGANANGWKAYQWGTQACGLDGLSAAEIIQTYYYPNVTVSGEDASPTPTATSTPSGTPLPTGTPAPSPTPPATGSATPGASPTPGATPTPAPTAIPAVTPQPTPTPAPLPTPPPDQQLPGGGQAGVEHASAPPSPPPVDPDPVVVPLSAASLAAPPLDAAGLLRWEAGLRRLWLADATWGAAPAPLPGAASLRRAMPVGGDLRLATFRMLWPQAMNTLWAALAREFGRSAPYAGAPISRR